MLVKFHFKMTYQVYVQYFEVFLSIPETGLYCEQVYGKRACHKRRLFHQDQAFLPGNRTDLVAPDPSQLVTATNTVHDDHRELSAA